MTPEERRLLIGVGVGFMLVAVGAAIGVALRWLNQT